MFARLCGSKNIKFIQADDPPDRIRSRDVGDRAYIFIAGRYIGNCFDIVDRIPSPGRTEQLFAGHERDIPPRIFGFFDKLVALVFAGNADNVFVHNVLQAVSL